MQAVLDFKKLTVPLTFNSDAAHQVHSISCDSLLVHVLQRAEEERESKKKTMLRPSLVIWILPSSLVQPI